MKFSVYNSQEDDEQQIGRQVEGWMATQMGNSTREPDLTWNWKVIMGLAVAQQVYEFSCKGILDGLGTFKEMQ